eukprot:765738-Hanusia_phi.AAC.2
MPDLVIWSGARPGPSIPGPLAARRCIITERISFVAYRFFLVGGGGLIPTNPTNSFPQTPPNIWAERVGSYGGVGCMTVPSTRYEPQDDQNVRVILPHEQRMVFKNNPQ